MNMEGHGALDGFFEIGFGGPWDCVAGAVTVGRGGRRVVDRRGRFDPHARRVPCANAHIGADFAVLARDSGRSGGRKSALVEFTDWRLNFARPCKKIFSGREATERIHESPRIPKAIQSGLRVSRVDAHRRRVGRKFHHRSRRSAKLIVHAVARKRFSPRRCR